MMTFYRVKSLYNSVLQSHTLVLKSLLVWRILFYHCGSISRTSVFYCFLRLIIFY